MKHQDKVLVERLARITEFQRGSGKLGAVSPALAQYFLNVGRTRIHELVTSGTLEWFGTGGFRMVKLASVITYARRCAARRPVRVRRTPHPEQSVQ